MMTALKAAIQKTLTKFTTHHSYVTGSMFQVKLVHCRELSLSSAFVVKVESRDHLRAVCRQLSATQVVATGGGDYSKPFIMSMVALGANPALSIVKKYLESALENETAEAMSTGTTPVSLSTSLASPSDTWPYSLAPLLQRECLVQQAGFSD